MFGINSLRSDGMPYFGANDPCSAPFVQLLCNQNFNGLSYRCTPITRADDGVFLEFGHCSTALKERKEHKYSFPAYWIVEALSPKPAFTDSRGNRHRHLRYLDHSPPYQGRIACGQSSVLVFEWEWCAIDKDLASA